MKLRITRCPSCDSPRIHRVRKTVRRTFKGQTYVVPSLDLLRAIATALGDRIHLPALDRFPAWRDATPQPLE